MWTTRWPRSRAEALLGRAAFACCLILPLALLHARAVADIAIVSLDLCFLARTWLAQDFAWASTPFSLAAFAWWLWLVACSAAGNGGLGFALVAIRLPLLAISLQWVLNDTRRQRALWWMLAAAAAWIALQTWEQSLTGTNLFGHGRYVDGALTGPFAKPRAGPAFILVFFPVVVPAVLWLLGRADIRSRAAAACVAGLSVATMVLIGQRMPTALLGLGLAATALLLPRLRPVVLLAAICGALLLAAAPVVSPATYGKLVVQTRQQLAHFPQTRYGQIFSRAAAIAEAHPLRGLGFDGFRRDCAPVLLADPAAEACSIHPHNYYLEAADDAGLPGLLTFTALAATLLLRLAMGLRPSREPVRTGCLVAGLVAFWPFASTSAFTSLPNAGWVFLVAGLGFAAAIDRGKPGRT
jgi:O-antigen ligase